MPYDDTGIYRHYKGGLYEVIGLALEESTLTPVVVYRPLEEGSRANFLSGYGATMWTRPLDDFNAEVDDVAWKDATMPRFTKLTMTEIMATRNERLLQWARFQVERDDDD